MKFWNKRLVAVVPATKRAAFKKILERHGYGAENLTVDQPVVDKGAAASKAATHYCLVCVADAALLAAIRFALQQVNRGLAKKDEGFVDARLKSRNEEKDRQSRVDEVLGKHQLKRKGKV